MWLTICKKHGWTSLAESTGTLESLEERRLEWRVNRDKGKVSQTSLMPWRTELERQWLYYVPQQIPDDAVANAPDSVAKLKILDPAVVQATF